MTIKKGDPLTLNGIEWTIASVNLNAVRGSFHLGQVIGVWLTKPASPDASGDTIPGSHDGVYLTAAMLRARLRG